MKPGNTSISSLFRDHPESVGESYVEHFRCARFFGLRLLFAGAVCLIHAVLPFLFVKTASRQVHQLYDLMVEGRSTAKDRIGNRNSPDPVN